jgi:putative transposase
VVDEYSRQCLAIDVGRKQTSREVLRTLAKLMLRYGVPKHIRSDNGPEFCGQGGAIMATKLGVQTLFIEPGSPWENGYIESFNGKLRDELLNGKVFFSVPEAKVLTDAWRRHYNHRRPHSALGYRPPAPVVIKPKFAATS